MIALTLENTIETGVANYKAFLRYKRSATAFRFEFIKNRSIQNQSNE